MAAVFVVGLGIALVQIAEVPHPPEEAASGYDDRVDGAVRKANDAFGGEFADAEKGLDQPGAEPAETQPGESMDFAAADNRRFAAVSLATGPYQKKRVPLNDGSVLFVNVDSNVQINGTREIQLEKGEIFVEVAPRSEEDANLHPDGATFTVKAPGGEEISAFGTKFGVRTTPSGSGVLVTQGTVRIAGDKVVLKAGQEMLPGPRRPVSPSNRPAEALNWLRELDEEAHPPAAPPSAFLGGVLIAYDTSGREKRIKLKSNQIDVNVENGFAITTIDQTYSSDLTSPVEAVFYFPVPPDAAVTRFASSAGDRMVEADIVPRESARIAYRNAASSGGRPGLMEWQDANTFSMRVFPLEPGKKTRIQLSFTRKLNTDYGRTQYRLAGVGDAQFVGRWNARFRFPGGARTLWDSSSHKFVSSTEGPDLILNSANLAGAAHRDIVVNFYDHGRQSKVFGATTVFHVRGTRWSLSTRPLHSGSWKRGACGETRLDLSLRDVCGSECP